MKIQVEDISPIKKKISFEVPQEDYEKVLEQSYQKLQRTAQVKGFRKGKVPRNVLEKYYGPRTSMESLSQLVDQSYQQAVRDNNLVAIGSPKVSDLKMEANEPITFVTEIEVQPKIEAQHFEKIPVKRPKVEVSDDEIETELKNLQKSQAQWIPLAENQAAADGNLVTINFQGKMDGKVFEGGSGENVPVLLGSGRFLPEFEKALVGAKAGEEREFDITFPDDYGAEALRGKVAHFSTKVLEVKREELPNLDDEFAKDLGKHDSLEELKKEIRGHHQSHKEQQQKVDILNQVIQHLIEKNPFDIPETMIEMEIEYMWKALQQQLAEQRLTPEAVGLTEADYQVKSREEAMRRIKGFLLFDSVAVQNGLKVTQEDVDAKLKEVATAYNQPLDSVKKFYQDQGLIRQVFNHILEDKTLNLILEKAEIHE